MLIEQYKTYRTISNEEVYILATDCPRHPGFPIVGITETNGKMNYWDRLGNALWLKSNNIVRIHADPPWDYDPKTGDEVWVYDGRGKPYIVDFICQERIERLKRLNCLFAKVEVPQPPK